MATIAIVLFTVLVPTIYFGIQQSRLIANTYVQYFNSIGLETKKRGLFHFIIANGTYRNRKIQIKIRYVSRYKRYFEIQLFVDTKKYIRLDVFLKNPFRYVLETYPDIFKPTWINVGKNHIASSTPTSFARGFLQYSDALHKLIRDYSLIFIKVDDYEIYYRQPAPRNIKEIQDTIKVLETLIEVANDFEAFASIRAYDAKQVIAEI